MEGLNTLGRLGLEGLLLFMYPNYISSGLLTVWRAAERFYAEGYGFLFDNASLCYPCVCIFLPLSLPFIFYCGCDFKFGLDCLSILFIACVHFPHTLCLS